ncbi:DUF4422 domain-containing protein [Serratia fonticola]|uniref:DUF4422 domain-containing protein n=1 Tax=Serratia fonticola TaxID=47917 RepID=UPI001C43B654|nr:DUF4422 domain-containing protein [Serratia fonticola]QXN62369.1 DUF4422 domain-containing protein [Serratia fonticola]
MKIFVVTHKLYEKPSDDCFTLIKVGSADLGVSACLDDSVGDSISELNPYFCELTALYWLWKNNETEKVGLVHYRRYFSGERKTIPFMGKQIASSDELMFWLNDYDVIMPKPRNYFITNIKDHYIHAHGETDFNLLREEISSSCPEYIQAFDKIMAGKKISLYNMIAGNRSIIEQYCSWIFDILFKLEKKVKYQDYDAYQRRVFGFMAERLLNVWIEKNADKLKIKYLPVINIEGENLVKKAIGLIERQFLRGKRK